MDGETGFFPQATQQARRVEIEERQRQQEEQRKKMAAAMQEPSRSFKGPYQYLIISCVFQWFFSQISFQN